MGTDLKKFVLRVLRETRGIELAPDEVLDEITAEKNPLTGKVVDVHFTVVMKAAPLNMVITTKETVSEERQE